jgi:membrane protease YdiL (CAAX protease family)
MKRFHILPPAFPLSFFILAYALSWAAWIPAALASQNVVPVPIPTTPLLALGAFGPSLTAFILTARHEGAAGAWHLLKRGFNPRVRFPLLLVIIAVPITITGIAFVLSGGRRPVLHPLALLGTFVLYFFLGGSFGEEFGWRGYALPRLLQHGRVLGASVVLGAVWAVWHLPLFWVRGTSQSNTPFWLFLVFTVAFAVMFTWVHQHSGGNLFAALLLHTVFNLTVVMFPPPELVSGVDRSMYYTTAIFVLVAIVLIVLSGTRREGKGVEPIRERSSVGG